MSEVEVQETKIDPKTGLAVAAVKAYDLKKLGQSIVEEAKEVLHPLASKIVDGTEKWAKESAEISKTKIDDALLVGLPYIKTLLMSFVDKLKVEKEA